MASDPEIANLESELKKNLRQLIADLERRLTKIDADSGDKLRKIIENVKKTRTSIKQDCLKAQLPSLILTK